MTSPRDKYDVLNLQSNSTVKDMLRKYGNRDFPDIERVVLSSKVVKTNRKGKDQERALIVTNKNIYNCKANKYSAPQRVISLRKLAGITKSTRSAEFILHVPEEYDYCLKSIFFANPNGMFYNEKNFIDRDTIIDVIAEYYKQRTHRKFLRVIVTNDVSLEKATWTRTKTAAMTASDRAERWSYFMSEDKHSVTTEDSNPVHCEIVAGYWMKKNQLQYFGMQIVRLIVKYCSRKPSLRDYDLLTMIGEGTFASVFQVRSKVNQRVYALKVYPKTKMIEQLQVEHSKAENYVMKQMTKTHNMGYLSHHLEFVFKDKEKQFQLQQEEDNTLCRIGSVFYEWKKVEDFIKTAKCSNPFVTILRESFQDEHNLYFVMDYYSGGDLFHYLSINKKLTENKAKFIGAQVAMGMAYLHHFKCLWRSCKLEDILIGSDGYVAITDFGLGKILSTTQSLTRTFCIGGKHYLSPEIISMRGHGLSSDWWGFGCLLYELVAGSPPFFPKQSNNESDDALYQLIQTGSVHFSFPVSSEFKDLINQLLVKDYTKRLGYRRGFDEVSAHPWFNEIDWLALLKKELPSPLQLDRAKGYNDYRNFDKEFINAAQKIEDFNARRGWTPMKLDPWKDIDWDYP